MVIERTGTVERLCSRTRFSTGQACTLAGVKLTDHIDHRYCVVVVPAGALQAHANVRLTEFKGATSRFELLGVISA